MRSRLALFLFWTTLIAFYGGSAAGQMITSDRDPRLAINAWDGAQHGTVLRLHEGCRPDNPDCTWHWNNGMITSDRDPGLAINAWDGAQHGTVLRLHEGCRPDNPDCTWHWNNGMITSDRDPGLAINAWDGAQHGTVLRLHEGCRPDNLDCTWQAQLPSAPPRPVSASTTVRCNNGKVIRITTGTDGGMCGPANPSGTTTCKDGENLAVADCNTGQCGPTAGKGDCTFGN